MSENENRDASDSFASWNSQNLNQASLSFVEDEGLHPLGISSDNNEKQMQNKFQNEYQALKNTHLEQQKRLLEIQSTGVYTSEQKQTQQRALLTKQQREYQDLISALKRQFKAAVIERKCTGYEVASQSVDATEAKITASSEHTHVVQQEISHSMGFCEEMPSEGSPELSHFEAGSESSFASQDDRNELKEKIKYLELSLGEQRRKYSDLQKRHQIEIDALRKDGKDVLAMIVEEHKELCKQVILEERIRIENFIDSVIDSETAKYKKLLAEQHSKILKVLDETKVATKTEFEEAFENREISLFEKLHKEREENREFISSLLQMKVSELKFDLLETSREIARDAVGKESANADIKINKALKMQMERYEKAISSLATKLEEKFYEYLVTILESEGIVRRKSLNGIDLFLKSASSMLEKLISENISFPVNSHMQESLRLLTNREANYVSQNAATNVIVMSKESKDSGKISAISKEFTDLGDDTGNGSELDYAREKVADIEVDRKSSNIADKNITTSIK